VGSFVVGFEVGRADGSLGGKVIAHEL